MPELPEVETTKNGIAPHILNRVVTGVTVRHPTLRWPIPKELDKILKNCQLTHITRRAKYLLLSFSHSNRQGTLLVHLGMSGSLRIVDATSPLLKHDHVDIAFSDNVILRYCDPRRFGCILWLDTAPDEHKLLAHLGPEPLSDSFSGEYLWQASRNKKVQVKQFVMDQKVVVGIGNIYASEALFTAGVRPSKEAGKVSKRSYELFAEEAKRILQRSITQGGTTLRDFVGGDGKPGYFAQQLLVYGRKGKPCPSCQSKLQEIKISNRSSVFCPVCQR